ncbi:MAG: hypothetical protein QOF89_6223 [Acidobacteriota bacterium]|nr:hypothetical protein [Acidobacteriota bacterium]
MQWPVLSQSPRKPPLPQSSDEAHVPLGGQNFGPATAGTENEKTEARTPARAARRKAFFMGSSFEVDADSSISGSRSGEPAPGINALRPCANVR